MDDCIGGFIFHYNFFITGFFIRNALNQYFHTSLFLSLILFYLIEKLFFDESVFKIFKNVVVMYIFNIYLLDFCLISVFNFKIRDYMIFKRL